MCWGRTVPGLPAACREESRVTRRRRGSRPGARGAPSLTPVLAYPPSDQQGEQKGRFRGILKQPLLRMFLVTEVR